MDYWKRITRTHFLIGLTPIVLSIFMGIVLLLPGTRDFGLWLLRENNPIEMLTFIIFLFASIIGFRLAIRTSKKSLPWITLFYGLFAFGLFIIAMEEIAWGQWIFGFETPAAWAELNEQKETTLHNVKGLQGKSEYFRLIYGIGGLIGLLIPPYKSLSYIVVPKTLTSWFAIILIHVILDLYADFNDIGEFYDRGLQRTSELIELFISGSALFYLYDRSRYISNVQNDGNLAGKSYG